MMQNERDKDRKQGSEPAGDELTRADVDGSHGSQTSVSAPFPAVDLVKRKRGRPKKNEGKPPAKCLLVTDATHDLVRIAASLLNEPIYLLVEQAIRTAAVEWQKRIDAVTEKVQVVANREEENERHRRYTRYLTLKDRYDAYTRRYASMGLKDVRHPVTGAPLGRLAMSEELFMLEKEFGHLSTEERGKVTHE